MLTLQIGAVIAGLWALSYAADQLIDGSAVLARELRITPFVIGVVIIGFGTSLPELLASTTAAATGSGNIAIGNAVGSNLANIALILGLAALLAPLTAPRSLLTRSLPLLLLATGGAALTLTDNALTRTEGGLLLAALIGVMVLIVRRRDDEHVPDVPDTPASALRLTLQVGGGLALLLISAWVLIWGAAGLARSAGISELVIGLALVAVGTSLPELFAAFAAIRKSTNAGPLILGNVVGSNLFNTLGVIGLPAIIRPFATDPELLPSAVLMLILTAAVGIFLLTPPRWVLPRAAGIVLLVCYTGYMTWIAYGVLGP